MYVPLDVVPEIERRQAIRRQFVLKLELAFAMVMTTHASGNDRRRSCIATKRPELDNAVTNALKLMQLADECALEEYVATTLDPTMRAFLHPYLDQFQDDAPSVPRWRRWPF
ncbi:hypothetical protein SPRG_15890 [Saprolegnia parasitica CBS 223.65]|uniref:Uncharacterized protein n=1 Tax=Saprolegnia parasitica (strain CBS 223.65) TaxID=695850 RepID=A0A067BKU3_SAPPC|nr:hypothetical protein SPRG_15890 [Saprolegnia parasitica CBS 223.65]KDO18803.1 hypothetical protein SPRG_15890 [Saprolegnia parasitica CBS 223.65]|eukprot:XP_012210486.1 hypothetical protein SPRG_15890 [Saprolegnia parasitica CBS 223.65]